MYDDLGDDALLFKSQMLPGLASIRTFPQAVADERVAADVGVTRTYIHDVGVLWVQFDVAYRKHGLLVEDRRPSGATIYGFPYATF